MRAPDCIGFQPTVANQKGSRRSTSSRAKSLTFFQMCCRAETPLFSPSLAGVAWRQARSPCLISGQASIRLSCAGAITGGTREPDIFCNGVSNELWAVPFDASSLAVWGDPVRVLDALATDRRRFPDFDIAQGNGSLIYGRGGASTERLGHLVWVDRQGGEVSTNAPARAYGHVRISPDGGRAAVQTDGDVWIWDFARETLNQLTFDPGSDIQPLWTFDNQRIVFSSNRGGGRRNLYWRASDGTGGAERLSDRPYSVVPNSLTPNSEQLVVYENTLDNGLDVSILDLEGERRMSPVFDTAFDERNAELSPDARWIAYQSNESGQNEVYVHPFPEVDGGRWQVSRGGGTRPMWAPDGNELFYYAEPGRMMAVDVELGATLSAGSPRVLFEWPYEQPLPSRTFDMSPDGQRFLMIQGEEAAGSAEASTEVVLVQNWFEELKRLVPVN